MVASTPNGTRPRGAARRDALLDAVLQVVADEGVDAVTHRRVADVAGLPLASTTYWFESKEHLLTAALERAAERDIERLEAFIREAPSERPSDPLDLVVGAILDPTDDSGPTSRSLLLATYALLLEAARRPGASRRDAAVDRRLLGRALAAARRGRLAGPAVPRASFVVGRSTACSSASSRRATTRISPRGCGGSRTRW